MKILSLAAAAAIFLSITPAQSQEPPDRNRHGTGTTWTNDYSPGAHSGRRHASRKHSHRGEIASTAPGGGGSVKPAQIASDADRKNIFQRYSRSQETSRDCLTSDTAAVLGDLEAKFGKVAIVSTCVTKNIAGTRKISFHSFGRAVDFDAPSGKKSEVVRWLHENEPVFVMTYSDMNHIHFNTGQRGMALARNSHTGGGRYAKRHRQHYANRYRFRHHRVASR